MFISLDFKGPDCSSIGQGAFAEHGPFKPTKKGGLVKNWYSWNRGNPDPISIACLFKFAYTKN
jgi:hypothetical protein